MFLLQKIISAQYSSLISITIEITTEPCFLQWKYTTSVSFNGFIKSIKMWWMRDQPIQYSKDFQGPQQISKFFSGSYCLQMFARLVKLQMHFSILLKKLTRLAYI